jgi:hypothetical protein
MKPRTATVTLLLAVAALTAIVALVSTADYSTASSPFGATSILRAHRPLSVSL